MAKIIDVAQMKELASPTKGGRYRQIKDTYAQTDGIVWGWKNPDHGKIKGHFPYFPYSLKRGKMKK